MDTIFALATARGRSGVAVIRISGPDAFLALSSLCDPVQPRQAALRVLKNGGEVLDQALVLTFPAPGSFTGEDVVELQTHGSVAVIDAVLSVLTTLPNLRPAEAGEFTRRALENNRLDLAQVEGLSDLVEAETEAQRRQAFRIFSGELGVQTAEWRTCLVRAAALLEATIDFVDEDVPVDVYPEVRGLLNSVLPTLHLHADGVRAAERVRDGFEVAIVGAPNVGKSTLLNALAGREAAITSEVAGTTRDVIEVRMDLGGLPVTLLDTAGLRETDDMVEAIGVQRARERAKAADLRIVLTTPDGQGDFATMPDDIVLISKSDVVRGDISAKSGQGVDALMNRLQKTLASKASKAGLATRQRHLNAMRIAIQALESAQDRLTTAPELAELIAEDIRTGIRALDILLGRVDVEDVLDEIFSSFCIGK
jgi:tRNA modification GTPase